MKQPTRRTGSSLDALADDLRKVVRRHAPVWTDFNDSDPGVTLLEVGAWLAHTLDFHRKATGARKDPYRDFKFRVKLDGIAVAVSRISALRRTAEIVEHRDGSDPGLIRRLPGRLVYEPITLERMLGGDGSFEDWADQLIAAPPGSIASYRKTIRIEVLDRAERPFLAYDVYGCWPSVYRVLPDFTESLTLVPERWQRDKSVRPAEADDGRVHLVLSPGSDFRAPAARPSRGGRP